VLELGLASLGALLARHGRAQRATAPDAEVATEAYGTPAGFEAGVRRAILPGLTRTVHSSVSFTPLRALHGVITPNGLVFERVHGGTPHIDPSQHRLLVHGQVRQARLFRMADLMRMPSVSRVHFIECGANSSIEWGRPAQQSVQFTHGMLSCCEWTGVPLGTLLDELGVAPHASWMLAEGADAASLTRSIPLARVRADVILAYAQNGEMLRPEQGYPLRLIVPGCQGVMSVKWLRRLEISDQPFFSREETSKYSDLMPDGRARLFTIVQEAKSVITFPSPGDRLRPGEYEISGLAWSGRGKIRRVDVSCNGGRDWFEAKLDQPVRDKALSRFRAAWFWDGRSALLQSRAQDDTGYVQPTYRQLVDVRGTRSIYHNNAIQTWHLVPNGELRNVRV
jgi:sulfane dehydrogenase subunit SoxC